MEKPKTFIEGQTGRCYLRKKEKPFTLTPHPAVSVEDNFVWIDDRNPHNRLIDPVGIHTEIKPKGDKKRESLE